MMGSVLDVACLIRIGTKQLFVTLKAISYKAAA